MTKNEAMRQIEKQIERQMLLGREIDGSYGRCNWVLFDKTLHLGASGHGAYAVQIDLDALFSEGTETAHTTLRRAFELFHG